MKSMFDGLYEPAAPRRHRVLDVRALRHAARQDDDQFSRDAALRLLGNPSGGEQAVDRLLSDAPTLAQVDRGRNVILGFIMGEPEMDELNAALGELLNASKADDADWVGLAAVAVMDECNRLMRAGFDGACLAALLRGWSRSTDGAPVINVTFDGGE
jgi:hypothetical protein